MTTMLEPIFIWNGPNLSPLGERESAIYGPATLTEIKRLGIDRSKHFGRTVDFRQSNCEGALVDFVPALEQACGTIINPAGSNFTSIARLDALKMVQGAKIEAHLSNIHSREEVRHRSFVSKTGNDVIASLGALGYDLAIEAARVFNKNQIPGAE